MIRLGRIAAFLLLGLTVGARAQVRSPLARLRPILEISLSAPGSVAPALEPAKAELLLELSHAIAVDERAPAADVIEASPAQVLSSVNAALKDIPAESLRSMPAEELHGLAGVILDNLKPGSADPAVLDAGAAAAARAAARGLMLRRGRPLSETRLNPEEPYVPDVRIVRGVPPEVRELRPSREPGAWRDGPARIYRHYTTPERLKAIRRAGRLENGSTPYVQVFSSMFSKVFEDLSGIFLTAPEVAPGDVGVGRAAAHVDVRLPDGFPLLEIEPGRIFLVPLPGRAKGDAGPRLGMPVDIVGYGPRSEDRVDRLMRRIAGVLTPDLLKKEWRGKSDNPLYGHCYAASEALYHRLGGKASGFKAMVIRHEGSTHWFLKHESGRIADPTAGQFRTPVPYEKAKPIGFLTRQPSKRAAEILRRLDRED